MHQTVPSRVSWAVLVVGFGAVAVMAALITFVGGDLFANTVSNIGSGIITSSAAIVAVVAALSMESGSPVRGQWLPIGLGLACFALGDIIWAYYEVGLQTDAPWPGLADFAYVAGYPLMAYGVVRAALAWKGRVALRPGLVTAVVLGLISTALLWVFVVSPSVIGQGLSAAETAISVFYPVADVLFGLVPAIFVVLVLRQLGSGKLAWPWLTVGFGVLLYSFADALYAVLNARGTYAEGNIVDYGWAAGYVAVAVGASLARDLARPAPAVSSSGTGQ